MKKIVCILILLMMVCILPSCKQDYNEANSCSGSNAEESSLELIDYEIKDDDKYLYSSINFASYLERQNKSSIGEPESGDSISNIPSDLQAFFNNDYYIAKSIALSIYSETNIKEFNNVIVGMPIPRMNYTNKLSYVKTSFTDNLSSLYNNFSFNLSNELQKITYKYDLYENGTYTKISIGVDDDKNIYLLFFEQSIIEKGKYDIGQGYLLKPFTNDKDYGGIFKLASTLNLLNEINTNKSFNLSDYKAVIREQRDYYAFGQNLILVDDHVNNTKQILLIKNNMVVKICDSEVNFSNFINTYYNKTNYNFTRYYNFITCLSIINIGTGAFKGIEIYAWEENNDIFMVILLGTNRRKTVMDARETLTVSISDAKKALNNIGTNEVIINIIKPLNEHVSNDLEILDESEETLKLEEKIKNKIGLGS